MHLPKACYSPEKPNSGGDTVTIVEADMKQSLW